MLRIGHFPSAPWAPYYAPLWAMKAERVRCVSSQVRELALQGELDATPMATVDWLEMSNRFVRLGALGIAYRERAQSVLLFSPVPVTQLGGVPIAVSTETTTSIRVLRALLKGRHGLKLGPLVPLSDDLSLKMPRLLIQDEALAEAARSRFEHVIDLGEEWWAWQHTPIVSAVWVARAGLPAATVRQLQAQLSHALGSFWGDAETHAERFAAQAASPVGAQALVALCRHFRYRLGEDEERGIRRMNSLLESRRDIEAAYEAPQGAALA